MARQVFPEGRPFFSKQEGKRTPGLRYEIILKCIPEN
jgi:hypothetical protein